MSCISQEKLDKLCDLYENMEYRCDDWFPTIEEIKAEIEPNIDRDVIMRFAVWILETSNPQKTDEKKEARRYLMNLVNSNIRNS